MQEEVLHRGVPTMQQGKVITIDIVSYLLGYVISLRISTSAQPRSTDRLGSIHAACFFCLLLLACVAV